MKNEYQLSKSDFEDLSSLLKITDSINTLYKKLYELELDNKIDSEEYKQTISHLTIAIEVEDREYQRMNLTSEKCQLMITHLTNDNTANLYNLEMELIISQQDYNRVVKRILDILINKINKSRDEFIKKAIPDLFKTIGISNLDKIISDGIDAKTGMNNIFKLDSFMTFLAFVQEAIENKNYISFLPELVKIKYDLSFSNKQFEMEMIANDFKISKSQISNSNLVSNLLNLNPDIYQLYKNLFGVEIATFQMDDQLEVTDSDFQNRKKAISSLLRQAYMRTGFLLIDEEILSELNYKFHEIIENPKNEHIEYKISESIIVQAFRKTKNDKEKHKELSFKR